MKHMFYPKIALSSIKKNGRLYIPYIITCIMMIMMFYIILFLESCDALSALRGADTIRLVLRLGSGVIAIFSMIFLFYTNSFLIRRRKKEFGLYNILGMNKNNLGKVLFCESVIVAFVSLSIALFLGIISSKFSELILVNMLHADIIYSFKVSLHGIVVTACVFLVIFFLLYLNTLFQLRKNSAISLLRSENAGEKAPKSNIVLGLLGVVILAAAYYIAVTIKDPLAAMMWFFGAVIMVIIASYLLYISGSVLLCKILQKKKNYYYNPKHFVSVSSMTYRMKRNGAGLASICILATMVLVMISSTASLYFGNESALRSRYPKDINITWYFEGREMYDDAKIDRIREEINKIADKNSANINDVVEYRTASIAGAYQNGKIITHMSDVGLTSYNNIYQLFFVTLEDYNKMMNVNETLEENEVMIYLNRGNYKEDKLNINDDISYKIKKKLDSLPSNGDSAMSIASSIFIVVRGDDSSLLKMDSLADFNGNKALRYSWIYYFDTGLDEKAQIKFNDEINSKIKEISKDKGENRWYARSESAEAEREGFYTLYGGLFFLGILLSVVFIIAAVLIIYYKQISEGYEDADRFEIMRKVGMTQKEIRKSINSQLLTVFFLPLIGAALHISFAFPIIRKLLLLFNLNNVLLFFIATVICFSAFALFYVFVYKMTSNAYFAIVNKVEEK